MNLKVIPMDALHPAVHGAGAVLVVASDGVGLALIAYGKATGAIGGILESYSGGPLGGAACNMEVLLSLLERADWILAHGARETKAETVKYLQAVERKPWVCSSGLLTLPEARGEGESRTIPGPLERTIQLVEALGQGDRLHKALHRAGMLAA